MTIFDIARASNGLTDDGVVIDDPQAPFIVTIGVGLIGGAPRITALTITPRDEGPIRRSWLRELPLRELFQVAVAVGYGAEVANESYFRRLAAGGVAPVENRVMAVYNWAIQVNRPGGPVKAIRDFWGVSRPTAHRWLRRAREKARASA